MHIVRAPRPTGTVTEEVQGQAWLI